MNIAIVALDGHLKGEVQAVLTAHGTDRLVIHPWDRDEYTNPRQVYVGLGDFDEDGEALTDADGDCVRMENIILNRDDFVEAILGAFPELRRA